MWIHLFLEIWEYFFLPSSFSFPIYFTLITVNYHNDVMLKNWTCFRHSHVDGVHIICIIPKDLKHDLLLYLVLYSILIVHAILIKSLWCKWKHKTSFYIAIPSSKSWWIVWVNSDRINKICVFAWLAFKRTANDVVSRKRKETLNMQEGTKI